jgi:para-aminobenzoate synthetase / 4-amino-4-deoxychorismate lyase
LAESRSASVVVELDGRKITPAVSCGLLAGTFRDELLERGEIKE